MHFKQTILSRFCFQRGIVVKNSRTMCSHLVGGAQNNQKMKTATLHKIGFAIVEMILVAAAIGLLAVIAFPLRIK